MGARRLSASLSSVQPPAPFPSPNNPSNEYVYLGGKLIATEEPGGGGSLVAPSGLVATTMGTATPEVHITWAAALSYPDGRVIENVPPDDPSIELRLTDRNGNKLVWKGATLNGEGGLKIENDVGHFIFITGTATQYKIIQPGVGGELLETLIDWKSVYVLHNYQATNSHLAPTHALSAELFASLFVADKITLPTQVGGLQYRFTYFASDTQPATGNFTDGWGQLASITLPCGAKGRLFILP